MNLPESQASGLQAAWRLRQQAFPAGLVVSPYQARKRPLTAILARNFHGFGHKKRPDRQTSMRRRRSGLFGAQLRTMPLYDL